MRFLADMGISPRTVSFIHDLGHDAQHLHELALDDLPDPRILERARQEGRVVLTHDLDFGELVRRGETDGPLGRSLQSTRSRRFPAARSTHN
ncbi:MAG: hypothetical protein COS85_03690, partial [Armatimonadetes bacterium CG07_land_8_20_14_0_80_59_28]